MKKMIPLAAMAAVLSIVAPQAQAQTAGSWMVRAGMINIAPKVNSGNLSAPSLSNSKTDVGSASQVGGGLTYMYTDNFSVDLPMALPFKHKLSGAGALSNVGEIGEVSALPLTVFAQYRFLEPSAKVRPYIGLGLTYAYFFNETGSGALTALTNPGGTPTKLKVDSQWALTPQIGLTIPVNDRWFVDLFYSKTMLKTKTTLSTGQTVDVTLDPDAYGLSIGYRF